MPPGLPVAAGITAHHAYLLLAPFAGQVVFTSNAVPLTLVP